MPGPKTNEREGTRAVLRHSRTSPYKVREVLDIIRGKSVRERTKDTWGLWRKRVLEPESNVQFGEGGAGTFSDGKLYSQIKDPRHLGRKVMTEFVDAGAPAEILYAAHPHIGTFKLVNSPPELPATPCCVHA